MSKTQTCSIVTTIIRKDKDVAFARFDQMLFHARLLSGLILENKDMRAVEQKKGKKGQ